MPNRCFWRAHYTTQKIPPFFSVFQPTPSFSFSRWAPNLISSTRRGGGGRNQGGGGRNQSVRAAAGLPSIVCYHRGQVRQLPRVRLSLAPESMAWRRSWALLHRFVFPLGTTTPALDLSAAWGGRRPPRPSAGARSGLVLSPVRILCPTGRCCHSATRPLISEEQNCRRDIELSLDFAPLP
jgi:hypothetical protein